MNLDRQQQIDGCMAEVARIRRKHRPRKERHLAKNFNKHFDPYFRDCIRRVENRKKAKGGL